MEDTIMKRIFALLLAFVIMSTMSACAFSGLGNQTAKLSRGTIEDDVYKNEFLGFEFTKPDSWVYSTDEEIADVMNVAVDSLMGEKFKDALEKNPAIYDMMVIDANTGTNINVVYENLKKSYSSNITVDQYVEALKKQTTELEGLSISFSDKLEKVTLGESEFTKCVCTTTAYGKKLTQVYYLRKVSGYMASVVVTIASGYTAADIEAMFK